jgi:hypothetical protein
MACALTIPLNRPIFPGSRDAQPDFAFPPAAEPVAVSNPADSAATASKKNNLLMDYSFPFR